MNLIALFINLRSKLSQIVTGDQAIFVQRKLFERVGGYAKLDLMEDVELCTRLKRIEAPYRSKARVLTSARRWQQQGICKTVMLMWALRFAYFIGIPNQRLAKIYRQVR